MTEVETARTLPGMHHDAASESSFHTLTDPRRGSSSDVSRTGSHSPRHPDLSAEAEVLSEKLINAINHQTNLEDTLAQTRGELEASRAQIAELEAASKDHEEQLASGKFVAREVAENEKEKILADLARERKRSNLFQQEKRGIEQELETLTASLFEEANKMVAAANKDKDQLEKKNQQLRDQMRDTEMLLASQQEQLIELKLVMQQMNTDREDQESVRASTAPSSPALNREETVSRLIDVLSPLAPPDGEISPAPSTSFVHLMRPICRIDLPAYQDFRELVSVAKSQPPSRVTSGTYGGLNVMGLGGLAGGASPNNSSTVSLNGVSQSPNTSSPRTPGSYNSQPPAVKEQVGLKETKFYKRLVMEDIEPTLRLDLAPGISWLTRRSLLTSVAEGSLIVEPIPEASRKLYGRYTACSVCGENRKGEENPRTHRMRTSDAESASRWQLCQICLEKVRATCDLVGFVRMVKDGVVRIREGDSEAEQEAWEELVRLRERMFWARMAAGVVPAFMDRKSDRPSSTIAGRLSQESPKRSASTTGTSPSSGPRTSLREGIFRRASVGPSPLGSPINTERPKTAESTTKDDSSAEEVSISNSNDDAASQQLHSSLRESASAENDSINKENAVSPPPVPQRNMNRSTSSTSGLRVAIPGGFD